MGKMIKDSDRIIVGSAKHSTTEGLNIFFVYHKDVTKECIPVDSRSIGEFMDKMADKKEFCKRHGCKLNLTTWEQVMA